MQDFQESVMEFANFTFQRQKVVCYGLRNTAGGTTTVLNFPTPRLADEFRDSYLCRRNFKIIPNDAQLVCFADYDRVMRLCDDDPRVRPLNYNRDFMMGTLAHIG